MLNIDLTTDQYATPPTPNRVDYRLIVNDTLINSPRQDPRFLYLATHKLTSNPNISTERRRKEFYRLDNTHLEIKFEITAKFHNLSPIQFLLTLLSISNPYLILLLPLILVSL